MARFRCNVMQEVQADWMIQIGGIEIDDITDSMTRNVVEQIKGKITVWIEQADSAASRDFRSGEVICPTTPPAQLHAR